MCCPSTIFYEIAWHSGGPPETSWVSQRISKKRLYSYMAFKKMLCSSMGLQQNELCLDVIFKEILCFSMDLPESVMSLHGFSWKCVVSRWLSKNMLCFAMNFQENAMRSLWISPWRPAPNHSLLRSWRLETVCGSPGPWFLLAYPGPLFLLAPPGCLDETLNNCCGPEQKIDTNRHE